jgi:hypothetical protein
VEFAVGKREILTRADVVRVTLGRKQRTQEPPGSSVRVQADFSVLGGAWGRRRGTAGLRPRSSSPDTGTHGGDMAGLVIVGDDLP